MKLVNESIPPFSNVSIMDAPQCISPNPDISGIGVRAAIYIQAILSLVHPLVAGYDGKIEDYEIQSVFAAYIGILLPGCALVVSTIIQARTFGLSAFHGLIVLNLSWINNTSAMTFFLLIWGDSLIGRRVQRWSWVKIGDQQNELRRNWEERGDGVDVDELDRSTEALSAEARRLEDELIMMAGSMGFWVRRADMEREISEWHDWRIQKEVEGRLLVKVNQQAMQHGHRGLGLDFSVASFGIQVKKENPSSTLKLLHLPKKWTGWVQTFNSFMQRRRIFKSAFQQLLLALMAFCASLHLMLFSGFGIWLWFTINSFGNDAECTPYTHLIVFNHAIPLTSRNLRTWSIVTYIASGIPAVNVVIWALFLMLISALLALPFWMWTYRSKGGLAPSLTSFPKSFFISAVATTASIQLYFIICTELTIQNNQHLLKISGPDDAKESDWTFGQTLALTLTLMPMIEVFKFIREKARKDKSRKPEKGKAREVEKGV